MGNLALKQLGIGTLLNGNKSYGIVTGTVSGLRISNVAGAYFIDNCSALLPYSGCRVRFKDSGGKYFDCTMGLRGTGETTTEELLLNTTFDDASWWSGITGAYSVSGGVLNCNNAGTGLHVYKQNLMVSGALYKRSITLTKTSGSIYSIYDGFKGAITSVGTTINSYTTTHQTAGMTLYLIVGGVSFIGTVDNPSLVKVLTPSISGIYLLSAPTIDSGFVYDQPSYTYQIWS